MAQNCNRFENARVPSQDAIRLPSSGWRGPGDPGPVRRGARPDRHRRPRRGVRRAAGAGAQRLAGGATVVGRKIGATSEAVQNQLGVDQPDFGYLLDDMDVSDRDRPGPDLDAHPAPAAGRGGGRLRAGPRRRHGRGRHHRRARARRASRSRCRRSRSSTRASTNWDIGFTDTVADNASSGLYVVGREGRPLDELEPRDVEMSLTINGEVRSSGNGAACLGDPLEALRWLAVQASRFGDPLRPATSCCPGPWARSCRSPRGTGWRRPSAGSSRSTVAFADDQE